MNSWLPSQLPAQCFYNQCPSRSLGGVSGRLVRNGFFFRSSDSRFISRFRCQVCSRSFSTARYSPCFLQKKRRLNEPLRRLLFSGVSQTRASWILKTNRKTIVRKLLFLATQSNLRHEKFLESLGEAPKKLTHLQFDEMESFERSKLLPLSIPLIVLPESRKILAVDVCSMPAKGPLASLSRQKYGPRADERAETSIALLKSIQATLDPKGVQITTDQNPNYPGWIRAALGSSSGPVQHQTVQGRRGCVVGQGELKRGGRDPLFALNHTAAMLRANVNRLFRRTWCTTKRRDRLKAHLMIYIDFHNTVLTAPR